MRRGGTPATLGNAGAEIDREFHGSHPEGGERVGRLQGTAKLLLTIHLCAVRPFSVAIAVTWRGALGVDDSRFWILRILWVLPPLTFRLEHLSYFVSRACPV